MDEEGPTLTPVDGIAFANIVKGLVVCACKLLKKRADAFFNYNFSSFQSASIYFTSDQFIQWSFNNRRSIDC